MALDTPTFYSNDSHGRHSHPPFPEFRCTKVGNALSNWCTTSRVLCIRSVTIAPGHCWLLARPGGTTCSRPGTAFVARLVARLFLLAAFDGVAPLCSRAIVESAAAAAATAGLLCAGISLKLHRRPSLTARSSGGRKMNMPGMPCKEGRKMTHSFCSPPRASPRELE